MEQWDPLGARDEKYGEDEYDAYLPDILALLEKRASVEELTKFLGDVIELEMGLADVSDRSKAVAESLLRLE